MKRILPAFLAVILALALTGCAGGAPAASPGPSAAGPVTAQAAPAPTQTAQPTDAPAEGAAAAGSSILIAYFTMPEDVDPAGADAVAGASIVVRDGEILGNVEYMAQTIQQAVGGDLLRIETVEEYPPGARGPGRLCSRGAGGRRPPGARHADREPRTVRHDLPRLSQLVGRHAPGALYLPGVV